MPDIWLFLSVLAVAIGIFSAFIIHLDKKQRKLKQQ